MAFVHASLHGDVVVLEIDHPPVNVLSPGVPEALFQAVAEADSNTGVRAIVIRGAGRVFVAGADITALDDLAWGDDTKAPDWHDVFARIEDAEKPIVMALHGAALGGGLELAMAGHYRIAAAGTQIGLPEVSLGLIPGAEGTQRLPRLAGMAKALDMCVTGRPIATVDALAAGIVDELATDDLTTAAVDFARRMIGRPIVRTRDRGAIATEAQENAALIESARTLASRVRPHETAPLRAIEAIANVATMPFDQAWRREREIFLECARSNQAKALIHMFLAERLAVKPPTAPPAEALAPIRRVAIIGESGDLGTLLGEILDSPASSDLVIVTSDDPAVAGQGLRDAARAAPQGAILAIASPRLDIDALAPLSPRPESVVGVHFFTPAPRAGLVEIVRGRTTSPDVVYRILAFTRTIGRLGVVSNGPGFVGQRLAERRAQERPDDIAERGVYALINEGARALDDGALTRASDIDVIAVHGLGFPAWRGGPMMHADLVGLGHVLARIRTFHAQLGERWRPAPLLEDLARSGLTFRERDRHLAAGK